MNDPIKNQLSAFLDGELERDGAKFLLRRLDNDAELRATWQRWHLARACLQQHGAGGHDQNFVDRIAAAVAAEPAPRAQRGFGPVLRWAGGFAIAASVAMVALLAVPPAQQTAPDAPAVASQTVQPAQPVEVMTSGLSERDLRPDLAPATHAVSLDSANYPALRVDPRLEPYLIRHNAATMAPGNANFVPYIQVVSPGRGPAPLTTGER